MGGIFFLLHKWSSRLVSYSTFMFVPWFRMQSTLTITELGKIEKLQFLFYTCISHFSLYLNLFSFLFLYRHRNREKVLLKEECWQPIFKHISHTKRWNERAQRADAELKNFFLTTIFNLSNLLSALIPHTKMRTKKARVYVKLSSLHSCEKGRKL